MVRRSTFGACRIYGCVADLRVAYRIYGYMCVCVCVCEHTIAMNDALLSLHPAIRKRISSVRNKGVMFTYTHTHTHKRGHRVQTASHVQLTP